LIVHRQLRFRSVLQRVVGGQGPPFSRRQKVPQHHLQSARSFLLSPLHSSLLELVRYLIVVRMVGGWLCEQIIVKKRNPQNEREPFPLTIQRCIDLANYYIGAVSDLPFRDSLSFVDTRGAFCLC